MSATTLPAVIYPLAVALVSAVFAGAVLWQYVERRRPYQLIWTIALLMSAAASAAYVLALPPTSSVLAFRLYYALGALLMAAWLGLGSIFLVAPRKLADWTLAVLLTVGALGAGAVFTAPIRTAALAQLHGGPGSDVFEIGLWLPMTIVLNTFGVVAVVGVALYSAWRAARGHGASRLLVIANVLIAIGDVVVGAAGTLARTGRPELFWIGMLAGWTIIFSGFLLTAGSRPGNGLRSQFELAARGAGTPTG